MRHLLPIVIALVLLLSLGCGRASYSETPRLAEASGTIRTVSGNRDLSIAARCPRGYAAELTLNGEREMTVDSLLAASMTVGMLAKTVNEIGSPGDRGHNAEVVEAVRRCIAFGFQDRVRELDAIR